MRVVVTGASGNVGTSVLEALAREGRVEQIVGIARRVPEVEMPKVRWVGADITEDDLVPVFSGADRPHIAACQCEYINYNLAGRQY